MGYGVVFQNSTTTYVAIPQGGLLLHDHRIVASANASAIIIHCRIYTVYCARSSPMPCSLAVFAFWFEATRVDLLTYSYDASK